jgi:hypothetical protein
MNKLALALLLAAALGFFSSPAPAADAPRTGPTLSAADRAFLASIGGPREPTPPGRAPRRPPAGGAGEKSLCTAEANCALGGTVSCEGNSSCFAADGDCAWGFLGYVRCDGVYTWCGGECCPSNFCTHEWNCAWGCNPCDYTYTCDWGSCSEDCECHYSTCPQ